MDWPFSVIVLDVLKMVLDPVSNSKYVGVNGLYEFGKLKEAVREITTDMADAFCTVMEGLVVEV